MNRNQETDIIAALASGNASAGIAVIRVSGQNYFERMSRIFPQLLKESIKDRHAYTLNSVEDNGTKIDTVVATFFYGPKSYTGEDIVEIACHGNRFIIQAILNRLSELGCRPAEAGEFTRRAYLNGKLDLMQAEAVADLIHASNEWALKNAGRILDGKLTEILANLRQQMIKTAGLLELDLDFSEEDLNIVDKSLIKQELTQTIKLLKSFLKQSSELRYLIDGIHLAIIGRPNAGKSSLLNALLGKERAIVSAIEGTTRDSIEESLNMGGMLFRIIDTAGIRQSHETIERIGVAISHQKLESADFICYLIDSTKDLHTEDNAILQKIRDLKKNYIILWTKSDLAKPAQIGKEDMWISVKNEADLEQLKSRLCAHFQRSESEENEAICVSNFRQEYHLKKSLEHLERASEALNNHLGNELMAFDLRMAMDELAKVSGEIRQEDVLNQIFASFCIGK